MKPSSAIADSTLLLLDARTLSGRLSTFETVPTETPARRATSLTLGARTTVTKPPCRARLSNERIDPERRDARRNQVGATLADFAPRSLTRETFHGPSSGQYGHE